MYLPPVVLLGIKLYVFDYMIKLFTIWIILIFIVYFFWNIEMYQISSDYYCESPKIELPLFMINDMYIIYIRVPLLLC